MNFAGQVDGPGFTEGLVFCQPAPELPPLDRPCDRRCLGHGITVFGGCVQGRLGKDRSRTGALQDEGGPVRLMTHQMDATRLDKMHRPDGISRRATSANHNPSASRDYVSHRKTIEAS